MKKDQFWVWGRENEGINETEEQRVRGVYDEQQLWLNSHKMAGEHQRSQQRPIHSEVEQEGTISGHMGDLKRIILYTNGVFHKICKMTQC